MGLTTPFATDIPCNPFAPGLEAFLARWSVLEMIDEPGPAVGQPGATEGAEIGIFPFRRISWWMRMTRHVLTIAS